MQNDPLQGSANPNGMNHPAHLVAAEEADRYTGTEKDEVEQEDNNKEQETSPEDFDKFNVDKVDELEKTKSEHEEKD
ncbi:hypothetical protein ACFP65_12185 [Marinilactibacillus sp. GCM10026970]|uniref:hypothetical protein n=1 Tax=Marinilactibacillus sp. GCM10026970 TaxID=3252642 RepID=UPI003623431E